MNTGIPDMLGEMDQALLDIWRKHVETADLADLVDYISSSETYHELVKMRDRIDACLHLLDELRLKVLPLLPDDEEEKEN